MEFEELQKIWDHQKGETMYAINENALHKIVTRKKNAASRRINRVEIMISLINGSVSIVLLLHALLSGHKWGFVNAALMAATVVYVQYFRRNRKKAENTFDRNMVGELDQAISNATYLIRFNYLLFVGYLIPLAVSTFSEMIFAGAPMTKWFVMLAAFTLSFSLVRWEQQKCNVPRKKHLLALKEKLME